MGTAKDFGAREGVVLRKCLAISWGEGEAMRLAMEFLSGEITQWDRRPETNIRDLALLCHYLP